MRNLLFCLSIFLVAAADLAAQKFPEHNEPDKNEPSAHLGRAVLVDLAYGFHFPGGDLADRFGNSGSLGGGVDFIFKNNVFAGLDGHYFYSQKVKEDPLEPIRTDSGFIIGNDMGIASVVLRERGQYFGGQVGKIFTFGGQKRAGLRVTVGGGFLAHKIRVQDDARTLTQVTGDYGTGYDRLTTGLALNEFVGYQFLGKARTVNFFAGLELNQGFTKSRRDWDFLAKKKLSGSRLDLRYGFRAGWTVPFYFRKAAQVYY